MPVQAAPTTGTSPEHAHLARLATELTTLGYRTTLQAPPGAAPYLHVTNPHATALSERIYVQGGNYWYSWGQPVGDCDKPATAATTLARVLRTAGN